MQNRPLADRSCRFDAHRRLHYDDLFANCDYCRFYTIQDHTTAARPSTGPRFDVRNFVETLTDPDTESTTIGVDIGEGSSNRTAFDDVDDFNGWSTASPEKPDGTAMPIGAGWKRSVNVSFIAPSDMSVSMVDLGLKRITVTATSPGGDATVIEALRSNQGANQRPPHADREIVTGASVAIELTSGVTAEYSRTLSKNHALDE